MHEPRRDETRDARSQETQGGYTSRAPIGLLLLRIRGETAGSALALSLVMRARHFAVVALVLLGGALVRCGPGIREDELLCEEAASHLAACCAGFDVALLDCHFSSGCGSTEYPALSVAASRCIANETCREIAAGDVCARAQKAQQVVVDDDAGGIPESGAFAEVCP